MCAECRRISEMRAPCRNACVRCVCLRVCVCVCVLVCVSWCVCVGIYDISHGENPYYICLQELEHDDSGSIK